MKIIAVKPIEKKHARFINASTLVMFHAIDYDNGVRTKLVFSGGTYEVEGDHTKKISEFMSTDENCGLLELNKCEEIKHSYWEKKGENEDA